MSKQWYGSLNNRISENRLQPIPTVGMGATEHLWSDRHAYTVLEVSKETVIVTVEVEKIGMVTREYPKWIKARQDEAKVIKGSCQDGSAQYEFTNDNDISKATTYYFNKNTSMYRQENRKWNGKEYLPTGTTTKEKQSITLGYKDEYYDPCF